MGRLISTIKTTRSPAFIIDFVVPTIVEEDTFSHLPGVVLVFDPDRGRIRFRDDEAEVITEIPAVRTTMGRDRFPAVEDRKERLKQAWHLIQQLRCPGAFRPIFGGLLPHDVEVENLPGLVRIADRRNPLLHRVEIVIPRNLRLIREQAKQLLTDDLGMVVQFRQGRACHCLIKEDRPPLTPRMKVEDGIHNVENSDQIDVIQSKCPYHCVPNGRDPHSTSTARERPEVSGS